MQKESKIQQLNAAGLVTLNTASNMSSKRLWGDQLVLGTNASEGDVCPTGARVVMAAVIDGNGKGVKFDDASTSAIMRPVVVFSTEAGDDVAVSARWKWFRKGLANAGVEFKLDKSKGVLTFTNCEAVVIRQAPEYENGEYTMNAYVLEKVGAAPDAEPASLNV